MGNKNLLAFAAGLGSGYLSSERQGKEEKRREREDAWAEEQRGRQRAEWGLQDRINQALSDSQKPLALTEGQVTQTPTNQYLGQSQQTNDFLKRTLADEAELMGADAPTQKPGYGVTGDIALGNRISTQRPDVDAMNTPAARRQRAIDQVTAIDPTKGMALENSYLTVDNNRMNNRKLGFDIAKLRREGVYGAIRAGMTGDANAVYSAFNAQGDFTIEPGMKVTPEERTNTWGKPVQTFTYEGTMVGSDGTRKPFRMNTQDAMVALIPEEDWIKNADKPAEIKFKADADLEKAKELERFKASLKGGGGTGAVATGSAVEAKPAGKVLPTSAASAMLENRRNLARAQTALALISGKAVNGVGAGDPEATGLKGYLPNQILNRIDPRGVDTRAAIADLGSLVIHDRSGAAVTAAEFPRLAPFIPTEKDDPETVRKKLNQFVMNYQALVDDTSEFYRLAGYNVPDLEAHRETRADPNASAGATAPQRAAVPTVGEVRKGYRFKGGNPADRNNWEALQ